MKTNENGESELEERMRLVRERAAWVEKNFPIAPEDREAYEAGRGSFAEMGHAGYESPEMGRVPPQDEQVS